MHLSLTIFLVSLWTAFSTSASTPDAESSAVRNSQRVQELQTTWKGIYFADAAKNCDDAQFEQIVTTLNESMELMDASYSLQSDITKTPGWNRFFMSDSNVPAHYRWQDLYATEYANVIDSMKKASLFPVHGDSEQRQRMTPKKRITFTCTKPELITKEPKIGCELDPNAGASTIKAIHTPPEYSNIVWFCPMFFFKDPRVPDLRLVSKTRLYYLNTLTNRAYVLVHEFFHCFKSIKLPLFIDDVNGTIPESKDKEVMIYGSDYATSFAWKNIYQQSRKKWRLNPKVAENADNYAWFFNYNYFHKKFGWTDDGSWTWDMKELRRDDPDDAKSLFADTGYVVQESDIHIPSTPTAPSTPTSTGGVPPDPSPTAQIIWVYTWSDISDKDQSWQITDLPVGKPLDWCNGNLLPYMVAAQTIDGTNVPNPIPFPSSMDFSKIDYGGQQLGYKQCSYKGTPDAPGTFDCPDFKAPVQCGETPKVRELITCPATPHMAKSYAVSMAICQWGKSNVK